MTSAPYSRTVHPGIQNLKIYSGDNSWERAGHREQVNLPVLVLPPGENPSLYRWPVIGLELVVLDDDSPEEYLQQFGRTLINAGAVLVVISRNNGRLPMLVYKRNVNVAAA